MQTGVGRTGTFFGYEQEGVAPDVMSLAKGLAGGVPIGAMVASEELAQGFAPGAHASTFGGNPLATAAAIAVHGHDREREAARARHFGLRSLAKGRSPRS